VFLSLVCNWKCDRNLLHLTWSLESCLEVIVGQHYELKEKHSLYLYNYLDFPFRMRILCLILLIFNIFLDRTSKTVISNWPTRWLNAWAGCITCADVALWRGTHISFDEKCHSAHNKPEAMGYSKPRTYYWLKMGSAKISETQTLNLRATSDFHLVPAFRKRGGWSSGRVLMHQESRHG
jgi:hypothetical protein